MKTHMQTHTLEHLWGRDRHWDLHPAEYCIQLSTVHLMKQVKFVYVDLNHEFAKKKKKATLRQTPSILTQEFTHTKVKSDKVTLFWFS